MVLQVMPGFRRARQNWRRSAALVSLATAPRPRLQPAPLPEPRLQPASLPVFLTPAPTHGGVSPRNPPILRSSAVGHVRASRSDTPLPGAQGSAVADSDQLRPLLGEFAPTTSEGGMATPRRPMGRSRQRSRSMTSPSALLEEYKMRWTCKVNFNL